MTVESLPSINATLNGLSTLLLLAGYFFIKKGEKLAHRNCMVAAFITSSIFLGCYLYYHYHTGHTTFDNPAWFRPFYLSLLGTHIILAVAIVPLILASFWFAFRGRFETHKKVVRWAWPLWMYVSVTGVAVYVILYHLFPQGAG